MGYSKSKNAVTKIQPYLDILLTAEDDTEFPSANSLKLTYYLRDGMMVASTLSSSPYKALKDKWVIKTKPDKVIAEIRVKIFDVGVPILARAFTGVRLPEVTEVMEVIGAAIKHRTPTLEFPNAVIRENGLKNLTNWCNANNYVITQSEPHLIITKNVANSNTDNTEGSGA